MFVSGVLLLFVRFCFVLLFVLLLFGGGGVVMCFEICLGFVYGLLLVVC